MANPHSTDELPDIDTSTADAGEVEGPGRRAAAAKAKPAAAPPPDDEPLAPQQGFVGRMLSNSAGWILSLAVHMLLIIVLALYVLPLPETFDSLLAAVQSEDVSDEIVDVPDIDFSEMELEIEPDEVEFQPETPVIEEEVSFSPFDEDLSASTAVELSDFGSLSAPDALTTNVNAFDGNALAGRGHASRAAMVRAKGGSGESEDAVAAALDWLARHQNRDGTWSLDHRGGECNGRCGNPGNLQNDRVSATALALLPFLGAGQTRYDGKYKIVVGRGMDALVQLGKQPEQGAGVSWRDGGRMYAHGIAAIAMTEAYGMTGESQLALPAQTAIDYIVSAQNPNDGGWRYSFQQPGDTSVVGWQLMALKSAYLAKLRVPHSTVEGVAHFLDLAAKDEAQSTYAYLPENDGPRPSTTAVGLLCRMYLGWDREHPGIQEGVNVLARRGMDTGDPYYNYYAAQVLFQYTNGTGPMWRKWNDELREHLVDSQAKQGHEKGSWFVENGHQTESAGRLYVTSLSCMTLEVYYRYMPLYQTSAVDTEFPE